MGKNEKNFKRFRNGKKVMGFLIITLQFQLKKQNKQITNKVIY